MDGPRFPGDGQAGPYDYYSRGQSEPDDAPSPLVRPYAVTQGRTEPRTKLALESLVVTSSYIHRDIKTLSPEYQGIVSVCREVRSVAEVSAILRIPLGVARVLVADMAAEGLVQIHQSPMEEGQPDLNLLERVLSGLRRL